MTDLEICGGDDFHGWINFAFDYQNLLKFSFTIEVKSSCLIECPYFLQRITEEIKA